MQSRCHQNWRVLGILLGILIATVAGVSSLSAQEVTPIKLGDYTLSGSTTFGYRWVDVNGSKSKYDQLFNLQEGFRLFDTFIDINPTDPTEHKGGWFDRISISAQGLGGDPFPVMRADIRKNGVYELHTTYRATQYFFDNPEPTTGPHHAWVDRRRFADLDFRYTPTRNVRLRFFYNRTERAGSDQATSYFSLPLGLNDWVPVTTTGTNPTPWVIPFREQANWFGASLDWRIGKTDVHFEQSYRTWNNPENLQGFANTPITLIGAGLTPLRLNQWSSFAGLNMPTTSVHIDHDFSRLTLRAGYVFTHASGPTSLNGTVLPTAGTPFTLNYVGLGTNRMTTQTAEAGVTVKLFERLDLVSDYRYQMLTQIGIENIQAIRSDFPRPVPIAADVTRWDFGFHTLDTVFTYNPFTSLSIRAGVRFLKQDIIRRLDGPEVIGTQRTKSYAPLFNVAWTKKKYSLRGDFERRIVVDPYVRLTPAETTGMTIRARLNLTDKWGIDDTFSFRNMDNDGISFTSHARRNATTLWWQPRDKVGVNAGFNYGNFSSQNTIHFLLGAPPLNLFSMDQRIDRTYFLGLRVNPKGSLTLGFTGQFVRSTGQASYTGVPLLYGPMTWPAFSAEAGYTFKKLGRGVFMWQRSYYLEDLFRATDYSSNGFTLKFQRNF